MPGAAPLIAAWLIVQFHTGFAVATYLAFCAAISLMALAFLPDHTNKDISAECENVLERRTRILVFLIIWHQPTNLGRGGSSNLTGRASFS